jgi:hypothetical protein
MRACACCHSISQRSYDIRQCSFAFRTDNVNSAVQPSPWTASPDQLASLQLLVESCAWPATLAERISQDGILRLPSDGQLSLEDLLRLRPSKLWNDELVNYSMWWLQQRDAHMFGAHMQQLGGLWAWVQGVSCHFFSSFFMSKLYLDAGALSYDAVRRWTRAARLQGAGQARHAQGVLSCSLIVAPCNLNNLHWVLVVADLDRCRILYLDPLGVSVSVSQC